MTSKNSVLSACGEDAVVHGCGRDSHLTGLTYDSRRVSNGGAFVATTGLWVDGHAYIQDAMDAGATLIIAQSPPTLELPEDLTWVQVPDSTPALGWAADAFYGSPSQAMTTFAVTGTNGKTTVTSMLFEALQALGEEPGLVGTVEHRFGAVRRKTIFTTPPSADLHALLAEMRQAGCGHVALEASSHGLQQHRLAGVSLDIGAFTNLTQDHLDYHGDMEAYFQAKAILFRDLVSKAVFNVDDPAGARLADEFMAAGKHALTFSTSGRDAHLRAFDMSLRIDGTQALVDSPWGRLELILPTVGEHNVANALTTIGMLVLAGYDPHHAARSLVEVRGAAGRLERVSGAIPVFVDYAHTPDALDNVCRSLRPLTRGRLIVVFGAGGDRDPGKRPKMGAVVQRWADLAVVTSDNPRTEPPDAIIAQILEGMASTETLVVEPDRRVAIQKGISAATDTGDVVLIAGKGHEDYQILGTEKVHFDDREEARQALDALT